MTKSKPKPVKPVRGDREPSWMDAMKRVVAPECVFIRYEVEIRPAPKRRKGAKP